MAFINCFLAFLLPYVYCQVHTGGVGGDMTGHDPNPLYNIWVEELWNTSNSYPDDWLTHVELHQVFLHYDTDKNGIVTREEYLRFVNRNAPDLFVFGNAIYDIYDTNGDNHLDLNDFGAVYTQMDIDGDGMVTKSDFFSFWNKTFHTLEHLHGSGSLIG